MGNFFGPGIVLTVLFSAAGYTIYTFIKAMHLEKMAKIEKGMNNDSSPNSSRCVELKLGMLMVGIAFGLLLAYILEEIFHIKGEVLYPSFILLFGGISLIVSFFVVKRINEKK